MPERSTIEQDRLDVLTGRDVLKRDAEACPLKACAHCGAKGNPQFVLSMPHIACTNPKCGASTGLSDNIAEAAAKWNRRDA